MLISETLSSQKRYNNSPFDTGKEIGTLVTLDASV
jgi:hypothetical protein